MNATSIQAKPAAPRAGFRSLDSADQVLPQTSRAATGATTMRAIVQRSYGSAEVLEYATVCRPAIAANEVLIEVQAAGLDRGTWHLMHGIPYLIRILGFGFSRPKQPIPGVDVAGIVVAIGTAVSRFKVGDEVFGIGDGTFAEYASCKEDKLALKPRSISFEQAAVASISGITALQALVDVGRLQPGQRVLIVGASGGVGSFTVQLAKALGAEVTGVASTGKLDLVRALGADQLVDYTKTDITESGQAYDLIIDIGGRNPIGKLRQILTERGTLVLVGGEGGERLTGGMGRQLGAVLLSPFVRQRLKMFISIGHHSLIERLAAMIETGAVKPSIGQRFALDQMPEAMRQLEAGKASGKTAIVVRPPTDEALR